jgi:hypothetical protein
MNGFGMPAVNAGHDEAGGIGGSIQCVQQPVAQPVPRLVRYEVSYHRYAEERQVAHAVENLWYEFVGETQAFLIHDALLVDQDRIA